MTDDVRNRSALVAMSRALEAVDIAVAALERAQRGAVRALPAGNDLLGEFDRVVPAVRVLQRKAEQALVRVPETAACSCAGDPRPCARCR